MNESLKNKMTRHKKQLKNFIIVIQAKAGIQSF